jgi:ribosomal protein S18 acetylase RimI-like enzyme
MTQHPLETVPLETVDPETAAPEDSPLDNAAWASLTGAHAHLAEGTSKALRYPADVSPFVAVPSDVDDEVWKALAELVGPGAVVALGVSATTVERLPPDWEIQFRAEGLQFIATDALQSAPEPEAVVLGAADAPEMLDLVARTEPGPFEPRTYLLGTYLGIRRDGALVAMAGERLHPPGFTEISAVCTDPAVRGQGLATRLVQAVAHGIRERGETPFLHTAASNLNAIRLYESIGFVLRRRLQFLAVRIPPDERSP